MLWCILYVDDCECVVVVGQYCVVCVGVCEIYLFGVDYDCFCFDFEFQCVVEYQQFFVVVVYFCFVRLCIYVQYFDLGWFDFVDDCGFLCGGLCVCYGFEID